MMLLMLLTLLLPVWIGIPSAHAAEKNGAVYVIPVDKPIEQGLGKFMERGFKEAEEMNAGLIILDINTPGGRVDTADALGTMIKNSPIETLAFVRGDAASAGSFLALNADKIVMSPGSMIGAAAMVDSTGKHVDDPKLVAYWTSKMEGAAQKSGRDGDIAAGMADVNIVVEMPEINKTKQKGEIIALSAEDALKVGYADHISNTPEEAAAWLGYNQENVFKLERTAAENISTFLTNPIVMTVLLFIGIAGVIIELIVPGFGVPGIVGIVCFVLYFSGNYIAGFAGAETWVLFTVGLVMMILEMFIPSFGILGILGSIALVAGVVRAAYDTSDAFVSLGIAFGAALVVIAIIAVVFKDRGIWNRFILSDKLSADRGYSSASERKELIGLQGISLTPLRPAGTAMFDGERVDVVTDGAFIPVDTPVIVIKAEGSRIVVQQALPV
ncbi:NfeD family protein [Paenibacillus polysaccharolyticus]|nr:NfeD family protein [Paenibacillus polysaccharolyticus]